MKALTIKQPWAWAIINAKRKRKDIENRTWTTSLRGTIAIHAGKAVVRDAEFPGGASQPKDGELEAGAIIGVVDLLKVVEEHTSPWFWGPYGFVLGNPRPLKKPIPIKGALGFWNVPDDISRQIRRQLGNKLTPGT